MSKEGGILDDLIITKHSDTSFYVVTNAGRRTEDLAWFEEQLKEWNASHEPVTHRVMDGQGLVALQGPSAAQVLEKLLPADFDLKALTFGRSAFVKIDGVECHLARAGYTGEDGFEISIPAASTVQVTEALLRDPEVQMAGLAARDSLRLEAGMCLYGHDLDESVSPIEGALAWCVGKDRRAKGDFLGSERVLRELKEGPPRRRVGVLVGAGSPARGTYSALTHRGCQGVCRGRHDRDRRCDLWHPVADAGQEHCHGARQERLPQKGHAAQGRGAQQDARRTGGAPAVRAEQVLPRLNSARIDRGPCAPRQPRPGLARSTTDVVPQRRAYRGHPCAPSVRDPAAPACGAPAREMTWRHECRGPRRARADD